MCRIISKTRPIKRETEGYIVIKIITVFSSKGATLTDGLEANPEVKQSIMEDIEELKGVEKERTHSKEEQKDEEEKREVGRWGRLSKLAHKRVETGQKLEERREASQHSKERMDQEGELWRSPEEQELQIMAQTEPEDKRDEEGSASRKTEVKHVLSLSFCSDKR